MVEIVEAHAARNTEVSEESNRKADLLLAGAGLASFLEYHLKLRTLGTVTGEMPPLKFTEEDLVRAIGGTSLKDAVERLANIAEAIREAAIHEAAVHAISESNVGRIHTELTNDPAAEALEARVENGGLPGS